MSRPRKFSDAAKAKRMTPDQIEPEQDDDDQFEWYDADEADEPEQEAP